VANMVKNATILVTGGTGFIGSHLVEKLIEGGHSIIVPYIDILPMSYFSLCGFKKHIKLVKVDLCNREKVSAVIQKNKVEFIFHLAAQTLVTDAFKDPYYTIYNNTISTLNLLEEARANKLIKGIIVASSDKAYGKTVKAYSETSPLNGDHPYDVSKSATDLLAMTYYKTYKTPVVVTRFANVYGEGDLHESRIVPGICKALATNSPLKIRSNGKFVRDYIYVADVISAYMFLYSSFDKVIGEAFNVSSQDSLSVIDVIKKAERSMDKKIKYTIKNSAVNEIPYQHLNDGKIRRIGWKSKYAFEEVLPVVFEWYKKYMYRR
jgi:CDP-glucose 4,6-dehydratase